ncbi:MAG: MBL fold metallo-hydrolase [Spirochaetota bacterium]
MPIKKFKPIKITDHFYQLGTPFFPAYLSLGDDAMIIEGGTGATAGIIQENLQELEIPPERVKYIVLTHTHGDHIGAVPHLRRKWKHVKLIGSSTASKTLGYYKVIEEFIKLDDFIAKRMKLLKEIADLPPKLHQYNFKIDKTVEDGSVIDLGAGVYWTVHFTPGHSTCQIALFEPKESILVTGDACGLYEPAIDAFWPNYFISLEQYCNSIRKLASFQAKRLALSHNGVISKDTHEFLKHALKATEDYHLEMLERVNYGDEPREVAVEKAQWIESFVVHMPYRLMEMSTQLLINRSQKDSEKTDIFSI